MRTVLINYLNIKARLFNNLSTKSQTDSKEKCTEMTTINGGYFEEEKDTIHQPLTGHHSKSNLY